MRGFKSALLLAVATGSMTIGTTTIAQAQTSGLLNTVLSKAADAALDRLSVPGAFQADEAVRIGVPGLTSGTGASALRIANSLGIGNGLTKAVNDAAGVAAKQAKPIFKSAINNFKLSDVPGVVSAKDGATQYLKTSAGSQLRTKIRPLILKALTGSGAFAKLGKLGGTLGGLTQNKLTDSVTDQAMNGIFRYMGEEESKLRSDPVGAGTSLLNGLLK